MSNEADREQIAISIQQAKHAIGLKQSLSNLQKHPDFIKIFEEDYFVLEASRLVSAKSNPGMQDPEQQKNLDNGIISIGTLQNFLDKISSNGSHAEMALAQDRETEAELLEESVEE